MNGVVMDYAAAPDVATEFKVTDSSGKAVITVGDADHRPAAGARIEVYKVTWADLLADGANEITTPKEIIGKSLYQVVGTHATNNLSATRVTVEG